MRKIISIALLLLLLASQTVVKADNIEKKVGDLVSKMTLEEKTGQMNQINYFNVDSQQSIDINFKSLVKEGKIGSLLNIINPKEINELQRVAIEESRLGIPLIIGRDVIHGFKTIFPIPLGQAATFNPQIVQEGARIAAKEARSTGINWTFAPMLDISRDARWGRIAESIGEDPYLTGTLGAAMVRGFQGSGNLGNAEAIAACIKHFVGYGASEGGRDYNSTHIPPHLLRNVYLTPFRMAVEAGAATAMTSFNDNDGIPASGDEVILRDILRKEWGFDGFVVSDWASMGEMIPHGFATNAKEVAELSLKAGVDMEMVSGAYAAHLQELVNENKVSMKDIDNAVKNILRIKFRLGLFDNPYTNVDAPSVLYAPEHMSAAREAAAQSVVMLKNDKNILPLSTQTKIAIIGPMANAPHDQLGTWIFDGDKAHTVTPLGALQGEYKYINYVYEPALKYSRDRSKADFAKAKNAAQNADVAVVFVGEESILSGEAHSLSNINLIGVQSQLIEAIKSTGKPVIVVVMAGRPLTIERDLAHADALLFSFHPGTMGGPAIMDLLFGKTNPSGKLPTTFVKEVGQIPMYYNHNNTGRPAPEKVITLDDIELEAGQTSLGNTSFYLDSGRDPLFPFGYGLSYSSFLYSNLKLSSNAMAMDGALTIKVDIKNTSQVDGTEIAQLYIRDLVGSIVRPIRELKGYERVTIKAGESKTVEFTLEASDLAFYGRDLTRRAEAGDFHLWVGGDSNASLKAEFKLTE